MLASAQHVEALGDDAKRGFLLGGRRKITMERKSSFSPRLGFLGGLGALVLATGCVSGSIADAPSKNGVGSAQGGSGAQPPGGGQGADSGASAQGNAGDGSTGAAPGSALTGVPTASACVTPGSPGPRLLRRLTVPEFGASIAGLFGDPMTPVAPVFNDSQVLGFTVDAATLEVADLNADQLMTNAEAVASWAVSQKIADLTTLAGCSSHDDGCAAKFVKNFGRRAFRTAIADSDPRVASYSKLFMAEASFNDGVSTVISAMLQSPYFLYRSELGAVGATVATGGTIPLTPYEVASSLSYLLTGSTPDDELLTAADTAAAGVAAGNSDALTKLVDGQATRLLAPSGADPLSSGAQGALMNFMNGWLGLDRLYTNVKDDTVQKLTDDQRADMATETKKFVLDVWSSSTNNTVGDLFNANYTFLNQNLASYYKVNASGLSTSFSKVPLGSARDGGILAQASVLIGHARSNLSSPTQRGHLVRSRLLCQNVDNPPKGLDVTFKPSATYKTTREQYLEGHASPDHQPCYGCHKIMDPIGVAFEHYDSFGNYRTTENGETIDATGTIYSAGTTGSDVNVDGLSGALGVQTYLATSDDVKACTVRYWSYYAFGTASWAQDGCTYDAIRTEAAAKSYSLKSILTAILHSPRFTSRVADQ